MRYPISSHSVLRTTVLDDFYLKELGTSLIANDDLRFSTTHRRVVYMYTGSKALSRASHTILMGANRFTCLTHHTNNHGTQHG